MIEKYGLKNIKSTTIAKRITRSNKKDVLCESFFVYDLNQVHRAS